MWTWNKIIKDGQYLAVVIPEHPNADKHGHVAMHRAIMENHIGRMLERDEHVHHINEDKKDNRVENLQVLSPAEHCRIHGSGRTMMSLFCGWCGKSFMREKRNVKSTNCYCCRSHAVSAQQSKRSRNTPHGIGMYRKGCRCDVCKAGNTANHKEYRERKRLRSE